MLHILENAVSAWVFGQSAVRIPGKAPVLVQSHSTPLLASHGPDSRVEPVPDVDAGNRYEQGRECALADLRGVAAQ